MDFLLYRINVGGEYLVSHNKNKKPLVFLDEQEKKTKKGRISKTKKTYGT